MFCQDPPSCVYSIIERYRFNTNGHLSIYVVQV